MVRLRMISLGSIAVDTGKLQVSTAMECERGYALAQRFLDALQADRLRRAEFLRPQ